MRQYRFDGSFITIADLMTAANTEACAHPNTPTGNTGHTRSA
jgi:hypothetical protein